jgi:hypothetical protein
MWESKIGSVAVTTPGVPDIKLSAQPAYVFLLTGGASK